MCVPRSIPPPSRKLLGIIFQGGYHSSYYPTSAAAAEEEGGGGGIMATTTLASVQISTTRAFPKVNTNKELPKTPVVSFPWKTNHKASRIARFRPIASGSSTPPELSSKVSESIDNAQQTCADDPQSGECVAAWDEVEELSAAASHAREKQKDSDPLEEYCKDNPETNECRTYDD